MYSSLPLKALRVFEAVSRLKSFQAAAEELHVTPSAVSHQMKVLEAWMGLRLVDRTSQGATVLPHGQLLAQTLSTSFSDIATTSRRMRQGELRRQLVIAVIPSVATCWLIPRLAAFRSQHADIPTRIIYAIHGQPVDFSEVDVALVYSASPLHEKNGVAAQLLLPGDSAPVCSASFLELQKPIIGVDDITRAGLLHDGDMLGWRRWLSLADTRPASPPDGPVFEDFNLLRAATLAGQGISICPLALIHDDLESGRLVKLSDLTILNESGYYLLHSARDVRNDAARSAFVAWAMDCASEAAGKGILA